MVLRRRSLVKLALAAFGFCAIHKVLGVGNVMASGEKITKTTKSNAEWKKELSEEAYDVLRDEGTERAFTSPLYEEKRDGVYVCAGCELPLFPSRYKYDSGTGWPSFYDVLPGHVETNI